MLKGNVVSIHIASGAGKEMLSVSQAKAVPGKGLDGDRYFDSAGTFSKKLGPDREVTLIEVEAVEAVGRDYGVKIDPREARRNIVTGGVALNHLVGRDFSVGEVHLHGIRLCEPCSHLAKLTSEQLTRALVHRGGLRAKILREGVIKVGDVVHCDDAV